MLVNQAKGEKQFKGDRLQMIVSPQSFSDQSEPAVMDF